MPTKLGGPPGSTHRVERSANGTGQRPLPKQPVIRILLVMKGRDAQTKQVPLPEQLEGARCSAGDLDIQTGSPASGPPRRCRPLGCTTKESGALREEGTCSWSE